MYLRSFVVDETEQRNFFQPFSPGIVSGLKAIGPVLAIGIPGEHLVPLGASRIYAGGMDWQTIARDLLAEARLVVIRAGGLTKGIAWEMKRVRCEIPPEKVALWFPNALEDYEEFRSAARSALRTELPTTCPVGYVMFDTSWAPQPATKRPIPPAASSAYSRSKLLELVENSQRTMRLPPKFRLRWFVWLLIVLWLFIEFFALRNRQYSLVHQGAWCFFVAFGFAIQWYISDPDDQFGPSRILSIGLIAVAASACVGILWARYGFPL